MKVKHVRCDAGISEYKHILNEHNCWHGDEQTLWHCAHVGICHMLQYGVCMGICSCARACLSLHILLILSQFEKCQDDYHPRQSCVSVTQACCHSTFRCSA